MGKSYGRWWLNFNQLPKDIQNKMLILAETKARQISLKNHIKVVKITGIKLEEIPFSYIVTEN